MKPVIIYVSGAPGSGKTTLAKLLSRQLNIHHISSDLVHGSIAFLNPSHDRGETIRDVFIPYLIDSAKLGMSFVVDHVLQKDIAKETIDDFVLVNEDKIAEGIKLNFTEHRIVSEGAAATSVMVAKDNLSSHLGKNIICLICGGNIEKNLFKKIIS